MKGLTVNKIKVFLPMFLFLGLYFIDCFGGGCFSMPKSNAIGNSGEEEWGYETDNEVDSSDEDCYEGMDIAENEMTKRELSKDTIADKTDTECDSDEDIVADDEAVGDFSEAVGGDNLKETLLKEIIKNWPNYGMRKKFEVSNTLRKINNGSLLKNKMFIQDLFKGLRLEDRDKKSKIEFYVVFGMVDELGELLNLTPNVSTVLSTEYKPDNKTLYNYAIEFGLKEVAEKLKKYKDAPW